MPAPATYDVIVVGARCAGSPLAIQLARAGLEVCVVDRASFPSETLSTHGIQPTGVNVLKQLGVFDSLAKLAPPLERATIVFDDDEIDVDGLAERAGAPFLCIRRETLDAILVDAAREAGAEVRTEITITGLLREGGRVAGVSSGDGEIRGRLVVGADGVRSTVANLVGAEKYHRTQSRLIFVWAYFAGVDRSDPRVWLGKKGGRGYIACPTDNGLFMAAVAPSAAAEGALRTDRDGAYRRALAGWPALNRQIDGAHREGSIRVMWRWEGFFRRSAGPGWALVGDAGHFKDPSPGQGISDALRQSVVLAEAIERALGGDEDPDAVLHDWWRWRDADAWEMYWFAHDVGAPGETPPIMGEIQRRITREPKLVDGMIGILNHDVPPSEVFTPLLALAATASAFRKERGRRREVVDEMRGLVRNQLRRRRGPGRA